MICFITITFPPDDFMSYKGLYEYTINSVVKIPYLSTMGLCVCLTFVWKWVLIVSGKGLESLTPIGTPTRFVSKCPSCGHLLAEESRQIVIAHKFFSA